MVNLARRCLHLSASTTSSWRRRVIVFAAAWSSLSSSLRRPRGGRDRGHSRGRGRGHGRRHLRRHRRRRRRRRRRVVVTPPRVIVSSRCRSVVVVSSYYL